MADGAYVPWGLLPPPAGRQRSAQAPASSGRSLENCRFIGVVKPQPLKGFLPLIITMLYDCASYVIRILVDKFIDMCVWLLVSSVSMQFACTDL